MMKKRFKPYDPTWEKGLKAANAAPRCGAMKRRKKTPCGSPAMANGRCRIHGGTSTGPRTAAGIERIRAAHLKHGMRTAEAIRQKKEAAALRRHIRALSKIAEGLSP
jgi:hypothetical protein